MNRYSQYVGPGLLIIGIGAELLGVPRLLLPWVQFAVNLDEGRYGLSTLFYLLESLTGVGLIVIGRGLIRIGEGLQNS